MKARMRVSVSIENCLLRLLSATLVGQTQDEGKRAVEPQHVEIAQATNHWPDAMSQNSQRLVRHDLRSKLQSILSAGLNDYTESQGSVDRSGELAERKGWMISYDGVV
jgi:hypothetical protein